MKKVTMYKTNDGELFECIEDAQIYENSKEFENKVTSLIEQTVPYASNQDLVMNFIMEHKKELSELFDGLKTISKNI